MPTPLQRFATLLMCALAMTAATAPALPPPSRWKLSIDSRDTAGPWLSARRGEVYSVRSGHVVAIDLASGRIRWRSAARVESRPAIGGRTIFAPVANGIVALDATTGKELGRRAFDETPVLITADFAAVAIAKETARNGAISARLIGFRDTLTPRWQRTFAHDWVRPDSVGNDTILIYETAIYEGHTMINLHCDCGVVALDAGTGNAVAATDGVEEYVGRDRQTLWFSVSGGGLKSLNLDTNESFAIHNSVIADAVRVEGQTAVAVIDGRLTKISLPGGEQAALRVDGRWVGGPANNTIFLSRGDGTYAQRLDGGKAIRVVTNTSDARFLTSTGASAYFATNDGSIVVVDLTKLGSTTRLATACRFVEGIRLVAGAALVHCDDDRMISQLFAFDVKSGLH